MNTQHVIIARFQTAGLNEDHKTLIDSVKLGHDKIVIVLGIAPVKGGKTNPLDFNQRKKMIKAEYPTIEVLPLADHPLDSSWSQNLDNLLKAAFPGHSFILYGSTDRFISRYSGQNEVVSLPENGLSNPIAFEDQNHKEVLYSEEFRTGIIYAFANTYSKVYPTVDVAVFRKNRTEILLGQKTIDKKWRLLGGFSDPADNSFEEAAERELTEECGPIEITEMKYEKSFRVDDWRYRAEEDKIISALFSADFVSGEPKGNDDIAEVQWFPLTAIKELMKQDSTAQEHEPQLSLLISRYQS